MSFSDRFFAATILKLIPRRVTPNHLTILRFALVPVVIVLLAFDLYIWTMFLFLLAALTDAIDGALARTRNLISRWGKIYDPLADKLLIGSIVILVVMEHLDLYLGLAVLLIEVVTMSMAWLRLKRGAEVQANIWGKIKMNLQVAGALVLLLGLVTGWPPTIPFSKVAFTLAVVFALMSLGSYGI